MGWAFLDFTDTLGGHVFCDLALFLAFLIWQDFHTAPTLGSRGYFFLIDTDGSWRGRVNEAQSAEEKKITSGHRSTQPHFHVRNQFRI